MRIIFQRKVMIRECGLGQKRLIGEMLIKKIFLLGGTDSRGRLIERWRLIVQIRNLRLKTRFSGKKNGSKDS